MIAPAPSDAASDVSSGEWLADPGFGVYVHVPFCRHRCHYCDFNTYEGLDELHGRYVDALLAEIERFPGDGRSASSVFFGGGTPTLLPPRALVRVLDAVRTRFRLSVDAEITVEANPETVDEHVFEVLLAGGFNRVSIGVQSLVPSVLGPLGRTHSPEVALKALRAARRAGCANVNADVIYGSPWESDADWMTTLRGIEACSPDHVSAYALTVEEGTPLATLVASGRAPQVDPDVQARRHEVAEDVLERAGYERYEVSNWARPGAASRHNILYWSAGDYAGVGAGAHGHLAGRRSWSLRLPREFIAAVECGRATEAGHEVLDEDARAVEALVLGLRLRSGVDLDVLTARFAAAWPSRVDDEIDVLIASGLLVRKGSRLTATRRGTLLGNEIGCRLL